MKPVRWGLAVLVTVIATAALGFGSRAPFAPRDAGKSMLRMSWRLRGEKIETCRERTAAELEALPVHMRTPRDCKVVLVAYRLLVRVDGKNVGTAEFAPAGAKADRPIFVFHDIEVSPGTRQVDVEFVPMVEGRAEQTLRFSSRIPIERGEIVLITLAPDGRQLVQHR